MEVQLAHLASGLAAAGHDVRLASVSSAPGARGGGASLDPRVGVVHLGARTRQAKLLALRRLAALARAADLVHCTGWDASLWGRVAAMLARRPVVVSEHTPGRTHQVTPTGAGRERLIAWHSRALDPFTARTVICAEWQRDLMRGEGVAAHKLVCIPNGVPVDGLLARARAGATREALGLPADAKVIVQIARFVPQKRQQLALETTARLRDRLGDVRIVFAGDGPELERVRAAADGAEWATFLGRHDNVQSLLALADLAVLPSLGEALPMAILEAIAVGVPIVATHVGDVGPLLAQTGAGIGVDPDDPDAFFQACLDVLGDPAIHARLAAAAVGARELVDAGTMVERYERVFDEARSA